SKLILAICASAAGLSQGRSSRPACPDSSDEERTYGENACLRRGVSTIMSSILRARAANEWPVLLQDHRRQHRHRAWSKEAPKAFVEIFYNFMHGKVTIDDTLFHRVRVKDFIVQRQELSMNRFPDLARAKEQLELRRRVATGETAVLKQQERVRGRQICFGYITVKRLPKSEAKSHQKIWRCCHLATKLKKLKTRSGTRRLAKLKLAGGQNAPSSAKTAAPTISPSQRSPCRPTEPVQTRDDDDKPSSMIRLKRRRHPGTKSSALTEQREAATLKMFAKFAARLAKNDGEEDDDDDKGRDDDAPCWTRPTLATAVSAGSLRSSEDPGARIDANKAVDESGPRRNSALELVPRAQKQAAAAEATTDWCCRARIVVGVGGWVVVRLWVAVVAADSCDASLGLFAAVGKAQLVACQNCRSLRKGNRPGLWLIPTKLRAILRCLGDGCLAAVVVSPGCRQRSLALSRRTGFVSRCAPRAFGFMSGGISPCDRTCWLTCPPPRLRCVWPTLLNSPSNPAMSLGTNPDFARLSNWLVCCSH
uniref:ANK_REP_REGION domain-containing protein n=1 Tax=Macrostomum lignano TaxID=282301 RepID=A0A1I8FGF2_9PLAT